MQRNFIAEGWLALHHAALDRGAEVDYYPPDYPELKARSYIDGDIYAGLLFPIVELANVDIEALGARSTLVRRTMWRWIRKTAGKDMPALWQGLCRIRTRVALLAAFHDATQGRRIRGSPTYSLSDPYSVVRFGHWLFRNGRIAREPPVVPVVWGLGIIGAVWGEHLKCSVCRLCFRRSRPGAAHCDFHSQSRSLGTSRSQAYIRYRRGVLAKQLEDGLADTSLFANPPMTRYIKERLALPDVLFPLIPAEGWDRERSMLIESLETTPRVIARARLRGFRAMTYERLIGQLRMHIDPNEWDNAGWAWRVLQAERWFRLEEEVAPGKRGKGKKTIELVAKATRLANTGRTNSQIAADLSVARATVSRWLTRYPDFKLATVQRDRLRIG